MIGPRSTEGATLEDAAASLREREHALRNDLFALTLRTDLTSEDVAWRRNELSRQLALIQKLLARAERLRERARERLRAT